MNADIVTRREWSATTLALVASIAACTVCAIAALIVTENFNHLGKTWTVVDRFLVVMFSYLQLAASTIFSSPVRRNGDVIEGMIYGEIGDDYVHTTVRRWMLGWFISVLCWSAMISVIGIAVVSAT